jgi:predicted phage tail protein
VSLDFDANTILMSLLVGSIGMVCFMYGKRQERLPQVIVGVLLMVYPYFVSNLILSAIIAVVLLAGLWLAVRLGW